MSIQFKKFAISNINQVTIDTFKVNCVSVTWVKLKYLVWFNMQQQL